MGIDGFEELLILRTWKIGRYFDFATFFFLGALLSDSTSCLSNFHLGYRFNGGISFFWMLGIMGAMEDFELFWSEVRLRFRINWWRGSVFWMLKIVYLHVLKSILTLVFVFEDVSILHGGFFVFGFSIVVFVFCRLLVGWSVIFLRLCYEFLFSVRKVIYSQSLSTTFKDDGSLKFYLAICYITQLHMICYLETFHCTNWKIWKTLWRLFY